MTCWPAGSGWIAPPSFGPWERCVPCWPSGGCAVSPDVRLRTLAEVVEHLGHRSDGIIDGTEVRVRRPKAGSKDRDVFISRKSRQNAVKAMMVTDADGRMPWCSPAVPGSCADITHARQLGHVSLLSREPAIQILADVGYQCLGGQTGGRVVTPPTRKFKKNAPDWYEPIYQQQRKGHSSRRIRVEHAIAHMKNRRSLARHLGRCEHMSNTIQAVAGLPSLQQSMHLMSDQQI